MHTYSTTSECTDCTRIQARQTRNEISEKIKIANFLMTCLIVCYHCHGFDEIYAFGALDALINEQIEYTFQQTGTIAMCYFFTVTGYLLFQKFSLSTYPQKIHRRLFSLLIPYFLWQCLYYATVCVCRPGSLSLASIFVKTFCFVKWPLNGALWYVYAVFLLAIAAPVLLPFFKTKRTGLLSVILMILFLQYFRKTDNPYLAPIADHGYVPNILYYLQSYLIGCFLGRFSEENTKNDVFLYIFVFLCVSYFGEDIFSGFFLQTVISSLPLMGLLVLPLLPSLQNKKIYSLSFLIYAIHAPLMLNLEKFLWFGFLPEMAIPVFVKSIFVRVLFLSLDIGLALLIHSVLKRCCPKLLAAFTGGRF